MLSVLHLICLYLFSQSLSQSSDSLCKMKCHFTSISKFRYSQTGHGIKQGTDSRCFCPSLLFHAIPNNVVHVSYIRFVDRYGRCDSNLSACRCFSELVLKKRCDLVLSGVLSEVCGVTDDDICLVEQFVWAALCTKRINTESQKSQQYPKTQQYGKVISLFALRPEDVVLQGRASSNVVPFMC